MEFTERKVLIIIRSKPFGTITNFEGWRSAVGMFGMDHEPTMLFMGDGVYSLLKSMDQGHIRMFKSVYESFDGRICVSKKSLEERELSPNELSEGVEILEKDQVATALTENEIVLTF